MKGGESKKAALILIGHYGKPAFCVITLLRNLFSSSHNAPLPRRLLKSASVPLGGEKGAHYSPKSTFHCYHQPLNPHSARQPASHCTLHTIKENKSLIYLLPIIHFHPMQLGLYIYKSSVVTSNLHETTLHCFEKISFKVY